MRLRAIILNMIFLSFAYAQEVNHFTDGINAFESGNFSKAKELLLPLANEGDFIAQGYITYLRANHNKEVKFNSQEITFSKPEKKYIQQALSWVKASCEYRKLKEKQGKISKENLKELEKLIDYSSRANYLLGRITQNPIYYYSAYQMGDYLGALGLVKLGSKDPEIIGFANLITYIFFKYSEKDKYSVFYEYFIKNNNQNMAKAYGYMGAFHGNTTLQNDIVLNNMIGSDHESFFWIMTSANRGNIVAMRLMTSSYEKQVQETNIDHNILFNVYCKITNHPEANSKEFFTLAHYYETGTGTPIDITKALYFYKTAYEKGYQEADSHIGALLLNKNDPDCLHWLQKADERGNKDAIQNLSKAYATRNFHFYDLQEALKTLRKIPLNEFSLQDYYHLFNLLKEARVKLSSEEYIEIENTLEKKSLDLNNNISQSIVDNLMDINFHLKNDYKKARMFAEQLMEYDNPKAYYLMGCMHLFGIDKDVDYQSALNCFQKAAELEYPFVWNNLGSLYYSGFEGSSPDYLKAKECYEKAFSYDIEGIAHLNYARMMLNNKEVIPFEESKLLNLLEISAERGHHIALHTLANYYRDTKNDYKIAIYCYELSANAGNEIAQYNLILMNLTQSTNKDEMIQLGEKLKELVDRTSNPLLSEYYALFCLDGYNEVFTSNQDNAIKYSLLALEKGAPCLHKNLQDLLH